ncbi:hypothetical protein FSP39_002850 [Pinctada imbricata]|uniref:GDNF/GAS1 domain-containing protein n=1 Tax=Pinctada imbricata TaxID=66713 RepID=A0AA88YCL1_PINIB|nr:hypothetical protein FSP39_002850 [Pinctada imbricata]
MITKYISKNISFVFFLEFCILFRITESYGTCSEIRGRCESRIGCSMALHTFGIACDDLTSGISEECTKQCQRALVSLISSENGAGMDFINCECGEGNSMEIRHCEEKKQRVQVCATDVINAWKSMDDPSVVISCTLALWLCEADSSCLTALNYFTENCSNLMKGRQCSSRCNNSMNILYQQKQAQKLHTCNCEGTEIGFDCSKMRKYTDVLCHNKTATYRQVGNHVDGNGATSFYFLTVPRGINDLLIVILLIVLNCLMS